MKRLTVPFIPVAGVPSPREVIPLLKAADTIPIDTNPWSQYVHNVVTHFTIAHNGSAIFLKFERGTPYGLKHPIFTGLKISGKLNSVRER